MWDINIIKDNNIKKLSLNRLNYKKFLLYNYASNQRLTKQQSILFKLSLIKKRTLGKGKENE